MFKTSSVVVGVGHEWNVERDEFRRRKYTKQTVETRELRPKATQPNGRGGDRIVLPEPCEHASQQLMIAPYLLGCWLGDGSSSQAEIFSGEQDVESIAANIAAAIGKPVDVKMKKPAHENYQSFFRILVTGLHKLLDAYGLRNNKHVPESYLRGSVSQRLELLRGLMDTDGHAPMAGECIFTNNNQKLAVGVHHLVTSLGMRAKLSEKRSQFNGRDYGTHWQVTFRVRRDMNPFRLVRKAERVRPAKQNREYHYVLECRDVGQRLVNCIQVEGGVYLIGRDKIPTRNSLLTSVLFPAWVWIHDPSQCFMFASYDQKLSTRDSLRCRSLIDSDWYQTHWGNRYHLTTDQNEKTKFVNSAGGWRIATSTAGRGMGEHPHWLMVDDPNNTRRATSDADRMAVNEHWWDGAMSSRGRMLRGHHRCVTQQRVAQMDLTGHILNKFGGDVLHLREPGKWQHLRLPMRYESKLHCSTPIFEDPRKGHEGALLWPKAFPEELVRSIEIDMGSIVAAGQLAQRPTPAGGDIFRDEWIQNAMTDPLPAEWLAAIFGESSRAGIVRHEFKDDNA